MSKRGYYKEQRWVVDLEPIKVTVYNTCMNCGSKWHTHFETYGSVKNSITENKWDYCDDCKEKYEQGN